MPVPVRLACCGDVEALSVTLSVPVRVPVVVGVKVRFMVQVAAGASEPPQIPPEGTVEETAKSPEAVMLDTVRVPVPELVSVTLIAPEVVLTVCGPKTTEEALSVAPGTNATPVPERATVCGEPVALSTMVSVVERAPAAVGEKVGKIPQDEPDGSEAGQLLV